MARKTQEVVITEENRDTGKTFIVTEPSAVAAAKFARKAMGSIARSGYIPESLLGEGMTGMADAGFAALYFCADADELLGELLACAKLKLPAGVRDVIESDIEESSTINALQLAAYQLIVGFSTVAAPQK